MTKIPQGLRFLFLALLLSNSAQAAELHGRVLENELGGSPMGSVEIAAPGANPTTTGSLGSFRLVLPKHQPGDVISVTVYREGYLVVNDIQVEATLLQRPEDRPLTLLLCKPNLCEEMRRRFYRLKSIEAIEASYLKKVQELEQQNRASSEELARLRDERDEALASAERAAEELARLKPGDVSELHRKAMQLFVEGQIADALTLLDEGRLQSSLEAAKIRRVEADSEIRRITEAYLLRARLLTLQLKFDNAERAFRAAIAASPNSLDANFSFAMALTNQKRTAEAKVLFNHCLDLAFDQADYDYFFMAINSLIYLLGENRNDDQARELVAEQVARARLLAQEDPEAYLPLVAKGLHLLSLLLPSADSEEPLHEALEIWRLAAGPISQGSLGQLSLALAAFGRRLVQRNDWDGAYRAFEEAVSIDRYLMEKNQEIPQYMFASDMASLGALFAGCGRLEEARLILTEAFFNYKVVVGEQSLEPFLRGLLDTSLKLADVLADQGHLDEARATLFSMLTYRATAVKSPRFYLPSFAQVLTRLGSLDRQQQRWAESRQSLEEALNMFRILVADLPSAHSVGLADVLIELAQLDFLDGHTTEAQLAAKEATEILLPLAAKNPGRYIRQTELLSTLAKDLAERPAKKAPAQEIP